MKIFVTLILLTVFVSSAEARRHKKFKGVIIVNQILKLDGTITRNGVDAPEYSGVKQGDLLETADKSAAVIRIPGLGIFRMGPNTKVKLVQFNDRNESKLDLLSGELLALYRRVGSHELKIPRGEIILHGTTFFVFSPKDSKTDDIRLEEGKIQIVMKEATKEVPKERKPSAEPTPVASPLFGATLSAPSATPHLAAATPVPTPVPPKEVQLVSAGESKTCQISDEGIELNVKLKIPDQQAVIKDLESLYALP